MSENVNPSTPAPVNAEPTSPQPENTAPVKEKIKVDGVEEEWSPEELKKFAQIGRAKEKRFEESARLKKEAEAKIERLKQNPWDVLKELGIDPRKVSEDYLSKVLEEEMLPPEEREKRALKSKVEEYEKREKEEQERTKQAEFEQLKLKHIEQLDQELDAALQNSSLPKSPGVIRRVAKYLYDALDAGEDVSIEEALAWVEDDYSNEVQQFFGSAKDPNKYLPKDLAKKLMDSHLSQVKSAPKYSQSSNQSTNSEDQPKRLSSNEWMKKIMS